MPPKKKGPGVQASSSSSAADDPATQAKELQQELRLWQTYPDACKLIKTQSEVYHAALEGAEKGKVFIYPIIAAFGQDMGAADLSEEEMDKRMRLVELLAVVDKAPEPTSKEVFRCVSESFGLCPALVDHCTDEERADAVDLLKRMHDIGEYLQLEKRLCARVKQLFTAQEVDMEEVDEEDVMNDKVFGPLLKATLEQLAATAVPDVLATVAAEDADVRPALGLSILPFRQFALQGALGFDCVTTSWHLDVSPIFVMEGQLLLLFGRGVADRELEAEYLAAAKVSMGIGLPRVRKLANRIVEALVVLGRGQAALKLVEEGGVAIPKYIRKNGDKLEVIPQ